MAASRTVELSDPTNALTLLSQVDSLVVNERAFVNSFDAVNRAFTATTPEGRMSSGIVDSLGRVVAEVVPGVDTVRYAYDARGRLTETAQGTRQWRYAYDTNGRLDSVIDPLSRATTFAYDGADRVVSQVLPGGRIVGYAHDSAGNLTSVTPPGRPAHTFTYTPVDLTASYNPPVVAEGATPTGYEYNLDHQLTRILLPDGDTVQFAYDAAGRPQSVVHQQGSLGYAYSPTNGNLTSVTAGAEGMSFAYDGSLLTGVTWTGPVAGSVTAGYDDDFRLQDLSVNGSLLAFFDYDGDGLLTEAGDIEIVRDPLNGRIDSTALGLVTTAETYDSFGLWSTRTAAVNGSEIYRAEYTRDALGRITGLLEVVEGDTTVLAYDYDDAGRLVEVETNGVVTATYVYDDNGNRLSVTRPSGVESGTYDDQDRLLTYAGATYGYSAAGELRFKAEGTDTTFYRYDAFGNLLEVNLPNGTDIEYVVDGFNRRVGKRVNGVLLQGFLYQDQLNPVAELDSSGTVTSRFVYGTRMNVPDYVVRNDTTYRIMTDHLGSVRIVMNAVTGSITQSITYDEFGREVSNTNPGFQPFGYGGGIVDRDIALIRFGARDFDVGSGRWTTADPIRFEGGSNLYAYVHNDPVNQIDLDGEVPIPVITGLTSALTDLGIQTFNLLRNGQSLRCIDWGNVLLAGFSGAAIGGIGKIGGWLGGKLFKVVPHKQAGRETLAWLRTKLLRWESHPIRNWLPSWLKVPHIHLSFLGEKVGKLHVLFPDPPMIAGAAIGALAQPNECDSCK